MKLVKASDLDNEQLLHFFAKSRVPGSIELQMRRMFSFFNQYRLQTDDYTTYLLLNNKDEIEALASMLYREAWLDGTKQTIGYATDLRVSQNRRAILEWSKHFLPILEEERAKRNCTYTFSVLAHSQRQAYNALIRPRNLKRKLPRYYQYRKFELISLHGLWPFHRKPLPGIRVRPAQEKDRDQLRSYLVAASQKKPLHYIHEPEDFDKAISRWRDLYLENFLLAEDSSGNIIGAGASWSPDQVQKIYAQTYSPQAKNLKDFLTLWSIFGSAHKLPREGEELPLRHLCFLNANNPDILYSILYEAFRRSSKKEILVYPHFQGHLLTTPPRSFIAARKMYGLYCVLAPGDPIPGFLKPAPYAIPPELETALL
jgi:hypothetical protein